MRALRLFLAALLIWLAPLAVTAAGSENRLTLGIQLEPPNLDPTAGASAAIDEVVSGSVFESLVKLDVQGQLKPWLALSWETSPDGKAITFVLRPKVHFHDGTIFDAEAVKFSLMRAISAKSTNAQREAYSVIDGVDILAPDRVRVRLKLKDANLIYALALGDGAMVSPKFSTDLAAHPVGTGPLQFVAWKRGDSVTLKRFDGYWGGPAKLDVVVFKFISDPTAALSAMQAGDVQLFTDFPAPESMAALRADPRFKVIIGPSEGEVILGINNRKGPLSDIRVRRALAHAIDKRAVLNGAMYGYGTPIGSHFPPQNAAAENLTDYYSYDPAEAKKLLAEAGYPNGFDVTLTLPPPVYARRSGEIIAAQLNKVGVRAHIQYAEWAGWIDQVYLRHQFDLSIVSHAEPLDYSIYGREDYYFGFHDAAVSAMLKALSQEDAPRAREALLRQLQREITEASPNVFLFQFPRLFVSDARVRDIWLNSPTQSLDWSRGYIEGASANTLNTAVTGHKGTLIGVLSLFALAGALFYVSRKLGVSLIVRRAGVLALTLLGASFVVFAVTEALPGDPAAFMMGLNPSPEALAALRAELGLDAPFLTRYSGWLGGLAHGDFGVSYIYKAPVADLITERFALSVPLALLSLGLALIIGLPAGLAAALRRGKASDTVLQGLGEILIATPNYVVSVLLVLALAVVFRLVPSGGFPGWEAGFWSGLQALILPSLALALPQAAVLAKITRTSLIEALDAPFVMSARARGLPERHIILTHAIPNAAGPVITLIGLQLPYLLAGSAIIETVFSLPGLGRLAFQAVSQRDLIVVQGVVMVLVALVIVSSFVVDIVQSLLDPRQQKAGQS
jgi:peptide/nickel transport system substrate-binding protein